MRLRIALLLWLLLASCGPRTAEKLVVIEVDGRRIERQTQAASIGEVLNEAGIQRGPLDRVTPDLNDPTDRVTRITVTRVREELLSEQRVVAFSRTLLRDEAIAEGLSRIIQLGVNGHEELIYKVVYENGAESTRDLVSQRTTELAREEIVLVGAKGFLRSVPLAGTIFYVSNGNAWLMRDASAFKRPLTYSGDLDGRVFAVAPDGSRLLFSRRSSVGGAVGAVGPLNSLWLLDTRVADESPVTVGIDDVLYADWLSNTQLVFSTAERTAGAPGWKAHNDLLTLDLSTNTRQTLMAPLTHFAYAFWGAAFALAPDHTRIVYAGADELGFVELPSGNRTVLQQFPVYQTLAGWVWTPDVAWSPDMRLVAATLHAPPPDTPNPELAPIFDVWVVNTAGAFAAQLAPDTGMFANPAWSKQGRIAYAQAQRPKESADSEYDLWVMNVDGSNKQRVFPSQGEHGMTNPQAVWSADGRQLIVLQDGNLFLVDATTGSSAQLTADGAGTQLRWR
jgi:hypothetical protein